MMIKSRRMSWVGHIAHLGDMKKGRVFIGNYKRNRRLGMDGKTILKWILKEIRWEGVSWIHLHQDKDCWWALVKMIMNL
jgi:hypothetical protein